MNTDPQQGKLYQKEIVLLTEPSMQTTLLKESLEHNLGIRLKVYPLNALIEQSIDVDDYLMIDMSAFEERYVEYYVNCKAVDFPHASEILINCNKDLHYGDLLGWTNLVGVFYLSDDISMLAQGIQRITEGEMWLSRKLAQEYIMYFRSMHRPKAHSVDANLTKREQEIIKLLGSGASNVEIAEKLFVSENTVKTHLHNVFKKIHAKNRLQALIWAREHMLLEDEPLQGMAP
ncbi:LuxR C-terminal-related transcriptional regulator [Vibrio ulleungensis]|jgi:LuxR family transcriptional regulator of csgAB operon|uniref:Helix-turn-helix transcriptional regulator n=1 Tax=Vibrio ulleungensis TaxID=2807619 RepID=A0ABS2HH24_9VIBR|nr:LuxR C-terminal-related transcriptional regulator [Vibrio ulleungensis]MBM7035127.1 helix-turn-helix transcriptional regulator [Vibrio ulleungensis]